MTTALQPTEVSLPSLPEALRKKINEPTPKEEIKHRKGRGEASFAYVRTSYIINRLNEIFHHLWDFKVIEQQIGKEQIWVKGELKVWLSPTFFIVKEAYGGSDIKRDKISNEIIDIADDLKAAASDALKKCASLLGIASDVYGGEI